MKYDGYEPRAAFYTEKTLKKQSINEDVARPVRKIFQLLFQCNASDIKKSWNSGQKVT
ncbi:conserved hypothetical protein [Enterobacter sp. 638]|uniref:Uncharacterized protein n=1 Tax=Enterobacter sp. (strain 638) TaxID=399742 RepID=A0A9J9KY57_ENT38|nr:conserved hypothetical protein [Enterobacter sp. 638]